MTAADDYADSAMISAGHLAGPATDLTSDQFDSVAGADGHSPGTTKRPAGHGAGSTSASAKYPIGSAMEPAKHRPRAARLSVNGYASSARASARYLNSSASGPVGQ